MCQFIESIRVEGGLPRLLFYHEERMNRTRSLFFLGAPALRLADYLPEDIDGPGVMKWRLVYGRDGVTECTCTPYRLRPVCSLRLVEADKVDYAYKFLDRSALERCFARRGDADDVLLVRDGLLTDTSIANIALYDGRQWCTPAHPLLCGVKRRSLLESRIITERDIRAEELGRYSLVRVFNALIDWGEVELPVSAIRMPAS